MNAELSRTSVVELCQKLLTYRQECETWTYKLFLIAGDSTQKDCAVKLWQDHVRGVVELEMLLAAQGGKCTTLGFFGVHVRGEEELSLADLVQHAYEKEVALSQAYETALKGTWPVNVRYLLERHVAQTHRNSQCLSQCFRNAIDPLWAANASALLSA